MKNISLKEFKNNEYLKNITKALPKVILDETIDQLCENEKLFSIYGFAYQDLSDFDLSKLSEKSINKINFSSSTIFPSKEKMPAFFNPKKIMNDALNFSNKVNFNDDKIVMAVIDNPTQFYLQKEFEGKNIELVEFSSSEDETHFHMEGVLSKIAGKNIGCSNNCKIIAYTINWNDRAGSTLKALEDVEKRIISGEKIEVISISNLFLDPRYGKEMNEKLEEMAKKLKSNYNCEIIDSQKVHQNNIGTAYCPIIKDEKNLDNYIYSKFSGHENFNCFAISKIVTEFGSEDGYWIQQNPGLSWCIPIAAYCFALCRSKNPNLSFEEFGKLCEKSAKTNANRIKIIDKDKLVTLKNKEILSKTSK